MPFEAIKKLSIIVPCCNEELNSFRFEKELVGFFKSYPFKKEFIFVDDGSTDRTWGNLEALAKKESEVVLLRHPKNEGLGVSLTNAFLKVSGDTVLTLDADLTFHPTEFPRLLEKWTDHVDCVTGSPFRGRFEGVSIFRRILSMGVNRVYQRVLGRPVTSASSIFRLYRRSALDQFSFECRGFDINAEIIAKFILTEHKVEEVPVILTDRFMGRSKINYFREIKNHFLMFGKILTWKVKYSHGRS